MVTLINPPNPPDAVSNKDTMGGFGQLYPLGSRHSFPPLDILYTAAVLRQNKIEFQLIECLSYGWELSQLLLYLQEQSPKIIALRTSTPTFEWDMRVARIAKLILPKLTIIVFGPHTTINPEQTLQQPFIDGIIIGEPELTLLEIAQQVKLSKCKGIWYKDANGGIVQNETRETISDLDHLPFPAWDLLPYHKYDGGELMRHLSPFVLAQTSRGCPHGCLYCPYPVAQGQKLRVRSPKNVVDELGWLANNLKVKAVLFRDPEFALIRERVVAICEEIIRRKIHLAWRCETRIENLDDKLIALMAKAGCIGLNIGIESAEEGVLRNVKRKTVPLKQAQKIIVSCKKNGIGAFCFFILGLPGETKESALRTINYALKLNPTFTQFTVATPYPGTELRKWAEDKGFIENQSLSTITGYQVAMRNEYMTVEQLQRLQCLANEAWEMQGRKVMRRILNNIYGALNEVKSWFYFQKSKLELLNKEWKTG